MWTFKNIRTHLLVAEPHVVVQIPWLLAPFPLGGEQAPGYLQPEEPCWTSTAIPFPRRRARHALWCLLTVSGEYYQRESWFFTIHSLVLQPGLIAGGTAPKLSSVKLLPSHCRGLTCFATSTFELLWWEGRRGTRTRSLQFSLAETLFKKEFKI